MATAVISRVPIKATSEALASTALVEKCKSLLRYDATHIPVFGQLAQALAQCGIQPLDLNEVRRYKAKKEYRGFTNFQRALIWAIVGGSAWVALHVYLLEYRHWSLDWLFTLGLGIFIEVCIFGGYWSDRTTRRTIRRWSSASLAGYNGWIPEFVLSKATDIAERVPSAEFGIDYLGETEERRIAPPRPTRDPFMWVRLGTEAFYLDVWNEPEFERRVM